jgi:hypothetical protein
MDPNWWLDFGVWGAGMAQNAKSPIEANAETMLKLLRGLHVGATIALAVFLWQMNEARIADKEQKIVMRTEIDFLKTKTNPEVVDAIQTTRLDDLQHRIDLISSRLDGVNQQLGAHLQHDTDRFNRVPALRGQIIQ